MRDNIRTCLQCIETSLVNRLSLTSSIPGCFRKPCQRNSSSSTTKKSQRSSYHHRRSNPKILMNTKKSHVVAVNDGLVLTLDQIKRIWKSNESDVQHERKTFDLKEFVIDFPYVNSSLLEESREDLKANQDNQDSNESLSFKKSNNQSAANENENMSDLSNFQFSDSNIAVQAEEKLYRMLSKVKSQENIPSTMRRQIKVLLMEELETVIDLWLNLSDNSLRKSIKGEDGDFSFKMEQEALAALFRASDLLLKFEGEFIKELRKAVDYEEEMDLFLDAPHTVNYQKIIAGFYHVFNQKEATMTESSLEKMQSHCSKLLKKMMKHIISRRMDSLNDDIIDDDNEEDHQTLLEQRGKSALSTPFKQLISLYTSKVNATTYTNAVDNATMASNVLQEMELYFHDFYTAPSPSNLNQQFLLSINPSKQTFNSVIHFYSNIAIKNRCSSCAMKTIEILNRMEKRYQAYGRKNNEQSKTDSMMIAQPNLSSYKAVFGAFASLDQINPEAMQALKDLMAEVNNDDDIKMDTTLLQLIGKCQLNGDSLQV